MQNMQKAEVCNVKLSAAEACRFTGQIAGSSLLTLVLPERLLRPSARLVVNGLSLNSRHSGWQMRVGILLDAEEVLLVCGATYPEQICTELPGCLQRQKLHHAVGSCKNQVSVLIIIHILS